jgi:hypothetical protein
VDLNGADDLKFVDSIDKQAMAHFVRKALWHGDGATMKHTSKKYVNIREMGDSVNNPGKKRLFKLLVPGMRNERTKFCRSI